jgi:hypothetical protein
MGTSAVYGFHTDLNNPPSGNYASTMPRLGFAVRCDRSYAARLSAQDTGDGTAGGPRGDDAHPVSGSRAGRGRARHRRPARARRTRCASQPRARQWARSSKRRQTQRPRDPRALAPPAGLAMTLAIDPGIPACSSYTQMPSHLSRAAPGTPLRSGCPAPRARPCSHRDRS